MSSPPGGPVRLARVVDLPGAVLLGLGSIVGTGVFVALGIAAGIAGSSILVAVALAAVLATANGLSAAQLAAAHPTSGGTYEYAHRYLGRRFALAAGWTFLSAKSASAATAALGFAGYVLSAAGADAGRLPRTAVALAAVAAITAVVASGIRRSSRSNAIVVSITLVSLLALVVAASPSLADHADRLRPSLRDGDDLADLLHATALVFVAFAGYGRIATLGEEVRAPSVTIPRAIIITLAASLLLYLAVTSVAVATLGAGGLAEVTRISGAPLEAVARATAVPHLHWLIGVAAITAMLGVILNLLLGLSRVVMAMARRADLPRALATIDERGTSPRAAVLVVGGGVAALVLAGDVKLTWTVSAFTVLLYYAITNLAALRLPAADRRYPRAVAGFGLVACVALAVWIVL